MPLKSTVTLDVHDDRLSCGQIGSSNSDWTVKIPSMIVCTFRIKDLWGVVLCKMCNIKPIPKLWPFHNKVQAASISVCHCAASHWVRDNLRCIDSNGVLPQPSSM